MLKIGWSQKMRRIPITAIVLNLFGLALPASAQMLDDTAVCNRLTETSQAGLFIAYSSFSANCTADKPFCLVRSNASNVYDPSSRFYYVPSRIGRSEEGVWHIRTQTRARNVRGADAAFVYRPAIRTKCSPDASLDAFVGNNRFVGLNRYGDHHGAPDDPVRRDPGLARYFHFQVQDPPGTRNCIATDDRTVFRDLKSIYGFEGVVRTEQKTASWFSFVGTATADVATDYAGLSSEFAYKADSDRACFGFSAPVPTRSTGFDPNTNWQPTSTAIVIKRIRGQSVINEPRYSVIWR
jgi:hypothetical protein